MTRWLSVAPVFLVAAGGCLATKGDIRLLQDELRATRSQIAAGDTSALRADDVRRQQIASLLAAVNRTSDSLRSLTVRVAAFQANTSGELGAIGNQMVQVQALLGQSARAVAEARQQLQALREGANAPLPPVTSSDSAQRAAGVPGAATLFTSAIEALKQGSFRTARMGFEQLLTSYPNAEQAPPALLHVGDAYKGEGNTPAADSVYQLVVTRYAKTPEAATALYRHGRILWDTDKKSEARVVLQRLIRDYPNADEVDLAKTLLRTAP